MSDGITKEYVSQAVQQFVMMLMHIERELEVEIPKTECELTVEEDGAEWIVTVIKRKIEG